MSSRYFVSIVVLCVMAASASVAVATVIPSNSILAATGSSVTVLDLAGATVGSFPMFGTTVSVGQLSAGGEIVVPDLQWSRILRFDGSGELIPPTPYAYSGIVWGDTPTQMTVANGIPYVSTYGAKKVLRLNPTTGAVDASIAFDTVPAGLAFHDGYLYAADTAGSGVWKVNADLSAKTLFASKTTSTGGIAFGPDGNLYVADYWNGPAGHPYDTISRYNGTTGAFMDKFASDVAPGVDNTYAGILFKPDGNLLVAACDSGEIFEFQGPGGATPGAYVGVFASVPGAWGISLTPVPEPSTLAILTAGLLGLLAYAWRKRKV